MQAENWTLWFVTLVAIALAVWRSWPLLQPLLRAQRTNRLDQIWERSVGVFTNVALHKRLLNIRLSGIMHLMIFTSFLVLFSAIVQSFGSGLFPGFSLRGIGGATWIAALQEVFALVILIALAIAVWQRFVLKPARFNGSNRSDATIIYFLVTAIVVSMLMEFASSIAAGGDPSAPYRWLSGFIAAGLQSIGIRGEAAHSLESVFYWAHIFAILGFLVYIPGSKHRHMFTAAPNIFFRALTPKGQLALPAPEGDKQSPAVTRYAEFTWKDLLDTLSCTECGRCQAVCPAHASGAPLSPKTLIMDLRDGMLADSGNSDYPIAGGVIAPETLWACTTCRACMEVCPLHIEHVPKIVQLRESLVEDGKIEPMLQTSLTSLQSHGNSFDKSPKQRAKWTRGLSFRPKDVRKEPVDILWFVGDFASYDPRAQQLSVMVGELLNRAGVDFGILYEGERNSGNDVRRVGDEGLFQMLAAHNIAELEACEFNRIMTTDPHTLNAIGSEYPALGANFETVHYSMFLWELISNGQLELKDVPEETITYHDPCYLGRYNGGFEAPRQIIEKLGHKLHDMGRCRENSFCCGAGGGRIWMDDSNQTERPSENRIKEALALGDATRFVVSCPKDVVMYNAAVQALGAEDQIEVWDLAELVTEAVE